MKLLETYANNCSVDIKNLPEITEKFFPIPIEKYITLQTKSGMPAKDYDWFQEVINLINPYLNKIGIKILWIGKENPEKMSIPYSNVIDIRNQTSVGQAAYIINRSMCHLSVDSWGCHFAAANGVPLVALYGSTTVANHSPYHKFNTCHLIESHRNGNKASFSREEEPKTVNFIKPEYIAEKVLEVLGISFSPEYETIEINQAYNQRTIESIPDQVINIANLRIQALIVRMDYLFNEHNLLGQLYHCPCSIVTDRPINLEILQKARSHVVDVIYNIKNDPKPDASFLKKLFDAKIPYRIITFLNNEEVNQYRLDFMEWGIIQLQSMNRLENFDIEQSDKFFYKTNKFLLSNGKIYQSFCDYKNNRPIEKLEPTPQQLIKQNLDYLWLDKAYNYYLKRC